MAKSTSVRQKRGGRPRTGITPTITIRLPAALISGLDKLAAEQGSNRSDVLREIVENALPQRETAKHPPRMAPLRSEPPGMERDSKGHAIPMKQRLPEDRVKAKRAKIAQPKAPKRKT